MVLLGFFLNYVGNVVLFVLDVDVGVGVVLVRWESFWIWLVFGVGNGLKVWFWLGWLVLVWMVLLFVIRWLDLDSGLVCIGLLWVRGLWILVNW